MAEKLKWKVLRRHEGDRRYEEGETREGTKTELGHLSPRTLELLDADQDEKSKPSDLNKAAPANHADKAKTGRKAK